MIIEKGEPISYDSISPSCKDEDMKILTIIVDLGRAFRNKCERNSICALTRLHKAL